MLLSPRAGIKKQTLEQYPESTELFSGLESAFAADKVQVTTIHQIGIWYQESKPFAQPLLVIVDEFHTLFAENCFASPLLYFQQQLEEWVNDPRVIVIALTATAKLPLEHIESGFVFKRISEDTEPQYKAETITIEQSKSLETILRQCPATQENKQLVFVRGSVERLIRLAAADDCASWLCSKSSNTRINGVRASSLMNQDHYQTFLDGRFPDGVNRMFLTSAFREGINITDADAQEIIIEGCTDIEIIQAFGRVRHDTKRLIVVIDKRKFGGFYDNIEGAKLLLETGDLEEYFERQLEQDQESFEGDKIPILTFWDYQKNELRFNSFALSYWIYEQDCYRKAINSPENSYFREMLGNYSKKPILYDSFNYVRPSNQRENEKRLIIFD